MYHTLLNNTLLSFVYRINPTYLDAVMNVAGVLSNQGKLAEAEVFYKKSLTLEPHNADAYNNYAVFLGKIGELKNTPVLLLD